MRALQVALPCDMPSASWTCRRLPAGWGVSIVVPLATNAALRKSSKSLANPSSSEIGRDTTIHLVVHLLHIDARRSLVQPSDFAFRARLGHWCGLAWRSAGQARGSNAPQMLLYACSDLIICVFLQKRSAGLGPCIYSDIQGALAIACASRFEVDSSSSRISGH